VKAREAKVKEGLKVVFRDVVADSQALEEMLRQSQGVRKVPVLVEAGQVSVGFGGS
jgi:glutaredoxin